MFLFEGAETPIHASMLDVSGKGLDFQDKMKNRRDLPTPEEIDRYVGLLIARIKNARLKKDKITLIKAALESASMQDTLDIEELEEQPTAVVYEGEKGAISTAGLSPTNIERVHRMVSERLYTRLATDRDLSSLGVQNLFVKTKDKVEDSPHLSEVTNLNTQEVHVLRKDRLTKVGELTWNEENSKVHQNALKKYITLPQNDYLLPYTKYSPEDQQGMVKKIDSLKTLEHLLDSYNSKPMDLLAVVRDCMKGAKFLDNNGLVLQDISIYNLAQVEDKRGLKKGLLFDLEGLYVKGEERQGRFANLAQEEFDDGSKGAYKYFPPEIKDFAHTPVMPSEMVYQFGQCINAIRQSRAFKIYKESGLPNSERVISEIQNLAKSMMYFDVRSTKPVEKRISLADSLDSLEKIMGEIERSQLN